MLRKWEVDRAEKKRRKEERLRKSKEMRMAVAAMALREEEENISTDSTLNTSAGWTGVQYLSASNGGDDDSFRRWNHNSSTTSSEQEGVQIYAAPEARQVRCVSSEEKFSNFSEEESSSVMSTTFRTENRSGNNNAKPGNNGVTPCEPGFVRQGDITDGS